MNKSLTNIQVREEYSHILDGNWIRREEGGAEFDSPKLPRPRNSVINQIYWLLLRPAGHGIVGSMRIINSVFDIPFAEIEEITHRSRSSM